MPASLLERLPKPYDADAMFEAFAGWAEDRGLTLYPAQEESALELFLGSHLVLSTPTGTGKSLVAVAAHAASLAEGKRSYYTAPIKALVSEKFFALVEIFGAENVGMVTGDSSVNPDAPIVCCTAEILANLALRQGADADVDQVVMDEFHYYADPDRGWAWQVPLLELTRAQFVLMSATLGDVTPIVTDLRERTGREVAEVTGVARPVPLSYSYVDTPVHETVETLLAGREAPIYIVHFSQAAALELAQALSSMRIASRERRDEIAEAIGGFRFTTAFGKTLSRLVRAGIGVHHAGMLPRYRRLVETLAQRGLLPVICGTDTLGVGINVPIRSVLLTGLSKFDGTKMRQLTAREFHQIAGRAGRAGYDTAGTVIVEAPEHEIENSQALRKAGDDPKKLKKVVRKKPAAGFVTWGRGSFDRLIAAEPEPLTPHFEVTAAMLINVIARGHALADMRRLIFENHQPRARQYELARRALGIYRTLVTSGIVQTDAAGNVSLTVELQPNFALNQPLSPFALAAIELLDPTESRSVAVESGPGAGVGSGHYALDVVSVIEATLDDPRVILSQQQFAARGEAVAAMKREGIEYEERMELLEDVTWPKPLEELLAQAYETFAASQPWVRDFALSPKSVVRDMFERAMSFAEYVQHYQLARSEGLVLRYLSDAYRAIRQTVPDEAKTDELRDIIEWLGELVRQVDSSLVDEWSELVNPTVTDDTPVVPPAPPSILTNKRAFTILVRNELFRRVQLAALEREEELADLDPDVDWGAFLDGYFGEHDEVLTGPASRSASLFSVSESGAEWKVEQTIDDPAGDHDWRIRATVDLAASDEAGEAVLHVDWIGRL
ncbi:DEAD/DEAH box helicase [Gryllotalpicola protaetiae]|uniref:DUF3516 domain-containing protein n=1 Tax=Gryllotalpicola protaetiae TaxID=2419771 RepID=A0A387BW51_9MICO|nr:DEAD/DEAH box helicase [Gryllotalpicola protaetiae]AYG02611.1 DUF3516 domain-containing protein [Gryllotalpicola protaetiae]